MALENSVTEFTCIFAFECIHGRGYTRIYPTKRNALNQLRITNRLNENYAKTLYNSSISVLVFVALK